MRNALLLCLVLVGCESGTAVVLDVTVPSSVSAPFSDGQRGVLVTTTRVLLDHDELAASAW